MRGAVAVKFANSDNKAREMLLNEAKIYNAFPYDLQGGDVPVVPKFYGCYEPRIKVYGRVYGGNGKLEKEEWTYETMPTHIGFPVLLLEACGKRVCNYRLSDSSRWERITTIISSAMDGNS